VNTAQAEQIHALWDDLSDFDVSQSEAAAAHLMQRLTDLAGVRNAAWAGALRVGGPDDPLFGWRVAPVKTADPDLRPDDARFNVLGAWDRSQIDPCFLLPMRNEGTFRTYSLRRDLPAEWFEAPFYRQHYGSAGIHDAVFVGFPLNKDCESHFGFYSARPVTDQGIELLAYALRGIKWFHRQLMLSHGLLLASAPLTPTEHKVLQLLLTEATEKTIAHQLGLAESTTHQHVVAIFRKFGVRSRAGLMSLWFNRPAPA
jgi:DNA-binding CsgD family transcriptional regulator